MQNHIVTTSRNLDKAKERLKEALLKLDRLIEKQNNSIHTSHKVRAQVIRNLDVHIDNLGTILRNHN